MKKILFIPLNTNHVMIFHPIIKSLQCPYELLCHDMISDSTQYHTEGLLRKLGLPYKHFPKQINRSPSDSFPEKITTCFRMKKQIRFVLTDLSPNIIVLAIDSDPIAQIFIKEAKKLGIRTLLIQESLMRPHQYTMRKRHISNLFNSVLRQFGIYISYIKYGTGMCDTILASADIAKKIFTQRGVHENRVFTIGYPKYDAIIEKLQDYSVQSNLKKVFLYAASTTIIQDELNIRFLQKLFSATENLGINLLIKLHPRSPILPRDVYKVINAGDQCSLEIVKEGDDTFNLLQRSDVLITVSSTVILEALMMNKECITVNYLAGESRLEYSKYNAVHFIDNESDIYTVIKNSLISKKSLNNKKKLLIDELYKLDGKSALRAATIIDHECSQMT